MVTRKVYRGPPSGCSSARRTAMPSIQEFDNELDSYLHFLSKLRFVGFFSLFRLAGVMPGQNGDIPEYYKILVISFLCWDRRPDIESSGGSICYRLAGFC